MTLPIRLNDTIVTRNRFTRAQRAYTATGEVVRLKWRETGEQLQVLYVAKDGDGTIVRLRESRIVRVERAGKVVWRKD
jgi:hypothetical protein